MKTIDRLLLNACYVMHPPWDTGIPAPELVRYIEGKPPGNAIDIGCGTGTNLLFLAQHGWMVTGIDVAWMAIQKAKKKLTGYPATLIVADAIMSSGLSLPGPYDLGLDMGCFHMLPEWDRFRYIQGLEQWMKPDGLYMLYAFQPYDESDRRGITKEQVITYFKDFFELFQYEQGQGRPSAWYYFRRK
jgi:cyclopropane fatty-acyl-phospholipid synthase-like methyltransferase